MNGSELVVGLEVHAELLTKSKMFCGCRVVDSVTAEPNSAVCPVCLGMPGMLPVINQKAIEMAMLVGLALNCTIQPNNVFARKNYFYPDLPKAYQISQYELPLARNGWVDIWVDGANGQGHKRRIGVRRVHLEEDTGKLTHLANGDGSQVDFNRSGVPLLEIVSEPDLRSEEETRIYAMKIRQILRYLAVNSGDMEKGVIRFEANVSVRPVGDPNMGIRTEIKNLNSFRALTDAINYERQRQEHILRSGSNVVQDTMGWSESEQRTFSQRGKEEAHDYRYFPDPDLPALNIADEWVEQIRSNLVELPDARISHYIKDLGLSRYEAEVLTEERQISDWFESAVSSGGEPKAVARWLINTLFSLMNETGQKIEEVSVTPANFVALINLVNQDVINNNIAKEVLAEMFAGGSSPEVIIQQRGLAQINDEEVIRDLVSQILAEYPEQVSLYLGGKQQIKGWFVGQIMRATRGKANPNLVDAMLSKRLTEASDQ